MERRGRFQGSIWTGRRGLLWLLGEVGKLCKEIGSQEGFFQTFREGYRVMEINFMKNRGGRFVEVAEFHSGSQQGSIRILEGRRGVGWTCFESEIRHYFLGTLDSGGCEVVEATRMAANNSRSNNHFRKLRNSGGVVNNQASVTQVFKLIANGSSWGSKTRA